MDKQQIANILSEIGTLLELEGESPFRAQAYHTAARSLETLEEDLATVVTSGRLGSIHGVGSTLQQKITELVTTGRLPFYDDLKARTPPGLIEMLRIPGLGPKKVKALNTELGIDTLTKLQAECEAGAVAKLKGFGAKTQEKILEGLRFLEEGGGRVRLDQALAVAEELLEELRRVEGIDRLELCGSLRRRKETIKDIDVLAVAKDPAALMDRFVHLPGVQQIVGHGETKSSVVLAGGERRSFRINADLRVVTAEQLPFALHYFTGSKEHNVAMRQMALKRGLSLNEYQLAGPHRTVKCKDEADLYRALGLDYVEPELREHTGELEAAAGHRLPTLLEAGDLRGTFHCHTTWSDGGDSLADMAEAARRLGLKYLGIADHSQSLTVARGLTPDRVRKQQEEIDALNDRLKGIRLFKGTEVDILPDGRLDFEDDVLATFDYVVASVHSHFGQSEEDMTRRVIRAIEHPRVTMLGHATGRLLLRREGYKIDLEAILQAAARTGTMVEINANPYRLDVDWVHAKRAKALGVKLVINPDAHSTGELAYTQFGVDVARRGWLEKGDVFNTLTAAQVQKVLAAGKKGRVSAAHRRSGFPA